MGIQAGSLHGGKFEEPPLLLEFTADIWRSAKSRTAIRSLREVYSVHAPTIPCDVAPLRDDVFFLQTGETNVVTHVMHFLPNEDVQKDDVVQIKSNKRLGDATVPAYYQVISVLQPTSGNKSYMRVHVQFGRAPNDMV